MGMRCWARDRGTPAHALGIGCGRWRREIREERGGRKDGDTPQEALSATIEGRRRVREGGQIGAENLAQEFSRQQKLSKGTHTMAGLGMGGRNTYTARTILHHENERRIARYVRRCALAVERAQADAVFLEAVRERPLLRELEPRGYE